MPVTPVTPVTLNESGPQCWLQMPLQPVTKAIPRLCSERYYQTPMFLIPSCLLDNSPELCVTPFSPLDV
jgi:hypothetical protein